MEGNDALLNAKIHFNWSDVTKKYVDSKGKIQEALKVAVRDGTVDVPEDYTQIKEEVVKEVKKEEKKVVILLLQVLLTLKKMLNYLICSSN